jgi:hypothetical protein
MIWLDQDGFWMITGEGLQRASFNISPLLRRIDKTRIKYAWAAVYREPEYGFTNYYCWLPIGQTNTTEKNNICVVYNWDFNSWRVYDYFPGEVAAAVEDEYGNEMLYSGDDRGYLWHLETGPNDDGKAIPGEFISRAFDFKRPEQEKTLINAYVWYRTKTATNIQAQISAFSDFGERVFPASGYLSKSLDGDGEVQAIHELTALADRDHYLRDQRARLCKITQIGLNGRYFQIRLGNAEAGNRIDIYRILLEASPGGMQA